ncbi:30S ribosomal protein S8 [Haliovirga abyssi]|uniref:Small ribosomal subunit protein uS8 n=1 Tax=Haliovirga abyssi TaxID=2996794 RepID=A0AAU9DE01_9FUSO|nr:30S ribosomal protein S8 [Haliovirga abyssi]BDU49537.1 30S ribosomal protein S8 [Haliovirga abyssi]
MYFTDPIADMLTRIRNANSASHEKADMPFSKEKEAIASVLKAEGYILNYKVIEKNNKKDLRIYLKYGVNNEKVIKGIKRISTPGRRAYSGVKEMPKVLGGLGIAIVSTPKGIITGKECKKENVGGEVLCYVW